MYQNPLSIPTSARIRVSISAGYLHAIFRVLSSNLSFNFPCLTAVVFPWHVRRRPAAHNTMVSLISSLRGEKSEKSEAVDNSVDRHSVNDSHTDDEARAAAVVDGSPLDQVNDNDQKGVQEAQATTLTWTRGSLICLFIG